MKNRIFFYLIFVSVLSRCSENTNRVYFTIPSNDRKIILPVQLNDSITANMILDTGCYPGTFVLDSTFVASHSFLPFNAPSRSSSTGSAWAKESEPSLIYDTSLSVKIGNTDLLYNDITVVDWEKVIRSNVSDGVFSVPADDTTQVWALNFEHNYLEIYPAEDFKMPENCFVVSMEKDAGSDYPFYIQLPMQIKCADGDTLTINRTYMIDTAMSWDIAIKYSAEELEFFNKREDAIWTQFLSGYYCHYTVRATLFGNFTMDSLRIYTFDYPDRIQSKYLIGQNFLKRFNVFFDFRKKQMGLQPIKNFQRIINPQYRRFHYLVESNSENKSVVTFVADYEKNYYKTAGLQVGDEVTAVNDMLYKNITKEQKSEFYKEDTLVFDIIRAEQTMRIIVPVDKNEEQGD